MQNVPVFLCPAGWERQPAVAGKARLPNPPKPSHTFPYFPISIAAAHRCSPYNTIPYAIYTAYARLRKCSGVASGQYGVWRLFYGRVWENMGKYERVWESLPPMFAA